MFIILSYIQFDKTEYRFFFQKMRLSSFSDNSSLLEDWGGGAYYTTENPGQVARRTKF